MESAINCFTLWHHFETLTEVLCYISHIHPLQNIVGKYENYSLLALTQLSVFAEASQTHKNPKNGLVVENVLKRVLSTDFDVIGGAEVIEFLRIYHSVLYAAEGMTEEGTQNAEALRRFVMRYIADHHKAFSMLHYEEIVRSLLRLPH